MLVASQITCTFGPSLHFRIVTFLETRSTVMWNALGVVRAPGLTTTRTFSEVLEHVFVRTGVIE